MIVCAPLCTFFSLYSFEAFLCPMTSWISSNGSHFGFQLAIRFRRRTSKNVYVSVLYLLKNPALQTKVMSSQNPLRCRRLLLRCRWNQPIPWKRHTLGNVLRHHCLRCGHDQNVISFIRNCSVPFPNAWNCPFRAMISCQVRGYCLLGFRPLYYVG